MLTIKPVAPGTPSVADAITLFTHYRDFLVTAAATHCFNFEAFRTETASLPDAYTSANGELLLAFDDNLAAACIAYRTAPAEPAGTCEIKRLFVLPDFRGRHIARTLIEDVLRRAHARGFTRAVLDTDVASMAGAYAAYLALGFTVYKPPQGSVHFLERNL